MSTFINNDITNGGRLLLAAGLTGKNINFTKIVMGEGYLPPDTPIRDMTAVVSPVVDVPITKMKINADGTVIIGGQFSNSDIMTEFFYRELALFAQGEDGNEILYCYGNAGDFAERITPVGGSAIIEKVIDIVTAVGTTKNITATIVKNTAAEEISFNDSKVSLGAANVQEALEKLATTTSTGITISPDPPTGNGWTLWLQIEGEVPGYPESGITPAPITVELDTAPLDAPGDFAVMYDDGSGETALNFTDNPNTAGEDDVIISADE